MQSLLETFWGGQRRVDAAQKKGGRGAMIDRDLSAGEKVRLIYISAKVKEISVTVWFIFQHRPSLPRKGQRSLCALLISVSHYSGCSLNSRGFITLLF